MAIYNVIDSDGSVIETLDDESGFNCTGSRTGEIGSLCGGCDGCLLQQARHSGFLLVQITTGYVVSLQRAADEIRKGGAE